MRQLTLDGKFTTLNKRQKIVWASAPKHDLTKILCYRRVWNDIHPLYDMIEQVWSEIAVMYPELNGCVFAIRVKNMSWCGACWIYEQGEIDFSSCPSNDWTHREVGATLAHELTHAYHSYFKLIPGGEKATDVFMLSRVPLKYLERPCYLECARDPFELCPERVQELAQEAIVKRNNGLRQYIKWFENQVNKLYYDLKGLSVPKQPRFNRCYWKKENNV